MWISKKYKTKQKILHGLHEYYLEQWRPDADLDDMVIAPYQLSPKIDLSQDEIYYHIDTLVMQGEVKYHEIDDSAYYVITEKGRVADKENKYLDESRDKNFAYIKDRITLISLIVGITASVFAFVNYFENKKNAQSIQELKTELNALKTTQKISHK